MTLRDRIKCVIASSNKEARKLETFVNQNVAVNNHFGLIL